MIQHYLYQKYMKNINIQIGTQLMGESTLSSEKGNVSALKCMNWTSW